MRRRFLLQASAAALLVFGLAVVAGRLTRLAGPALWWDVAGRHPATLPADLVRTLQLLDGELEATLFVSDAARMPSNLRHVEATTRALLDAMVDAAGGRFSYRVLDPDLSGAAGARYAAARRVSPIRVRRVVDDAESQAEIWSSLVFSRQGRPRRDDVLIQGIEDAHLPYLGALVAAYLRPEPPQAAFAVAAPPGFDDLPRLLSQFGPVVEVDVDGGAPIPADVDVLFWLEPRQVTPRHLVALRRYLAAGGTVVLAGSPYAIGYRDAGDGTVRFRAAAGTGAWERLLEPFGLRPLPDLVLDRNAAAVPVDVGGVRRDVEAPFHLRNLPAFRDFRPFRTPARGALAFVAPGPLEVDPRRVDAAGYEAHVAATTTERAWVRALPPDEFGVDDLAPDLIAPKQNLMVLLTPHDPWAGQLLVLAAASPFRDGIVTQPGFGHAVFLADLARTFASPERLVQRRVDRHAPAALPPLSAGGRVAWRLVVVGLVPALCLLLALRRLWGDAGLRWRPAAGLRRAGLPAGVAVGVLGLWLLLRGPLAAARLDATAARVHTPAPEVVAALRRAAGDLHVQLLQSPPSQLPPAVRAAGERARDLLGDAGIVTETVPVDMAGAAGVPAFEIERVQRDTSVTARVHSALRLSRDGRSTWIPRLDEATGAHLDFLLAAALRRLERGAAPVVAVVSDLPRLSPAEALEDYQKKGLSAPQGVDVYSRAKTLLGDYGYDVRHVSPRDPQLPPADAVVWFQPRRDSTPVLTQVSRFLAGGGHAIVALQHFNIQQRQYRGAGFETVHWPQPQFQDFDRYLRAAGVEQVREVLFDRSQHHLDLDTQVNRTAVREYDAQRVALPFLIRAVGADFAGDSPVTRNLGDLLFVWGNRFRLDPGRLRAAGLQARVLVTTTAHAWAYDWSGGWLPPQVFDEAANVPLPGPQALVVELEGPFPAVDAEATADGGTELVPHPVDGGAPGWLLLIGSSEMFKDDHLLQPGFAHDQLLLNAVARAALGPQLAALQARHATAPRGFVAASATARGAWRLAVIGAGPLLLGLVGAWRRRRRASP